MQLYLNSQSDAKMILYEQGFQCTTSDGNAVKKSGDVLSMQKIYQELSAWKTSLQQALGYEIERELSRIDERVSETLRAQKDLLHKSPNTESVYDSSDPASDNYVGMKFETSKLHRVDHAALVNGAVIVYSER